jgi:hypothetical protein
MAEQFAYAITATMTRKVKKLIKRLTTVPRVINVVM